MNSNQQIVPFVYENSLVRTMTLKNGEPVFFAMDIAKVLEHSNVAMMVQNLDDDEKGISKVYTHGGMQEIIILTEPGLYTVLIRSNKPQAKPFRRWVTHEVIPQIRKTGSYGKLFPELDARMKVSQFFQKIITEGKQAGLSKQDAVLRAYTITLKETGYDFSDAIPDDFRLSPICGTESGESEQQKKQRLILEYIARKGGQVTRGRLISSKILSGGALEYDDVLTALCDGGLIEVKKREKKKEWVYFLQKNL